MILAIWLVPIGLLKRRHIDPFLMTKVELQWQWKLIVEVNSPMRSGDEMIVPGDVEGSCNMVISIWSVERKTMIHLWHLRGQWQWHWEWFWKLTNIQIISPMELVAWKDSVRRVLAMWLLVFGLLNIRHIYPFVTLEVELQWQWK